MRLGRKSDVPPGRAAPGPWHAWSAVASATPILLSAAFSLCQATDVPARSDRLIRTAADRGVICVLDKRIIAGNHSQSFLKSLPKGVRVTTKLADIDRFFAPDLPTRSRETDAKELWKLT